MMGLGALNSQAQHVDYTRQAAALGGIESHWNPQSNAALGRVKPRAKEKWYHTELN